MKISVIMPTFNSEQYVESAIRSVVDQDYPEKELIVIDGGSTDGTLDIIKKYTKHIGYWVSEKDNGMFHAVNKGILKATGQIIGLQGADDFYKPGALTKVARAFEQHPDAALIYGDAEHVDLENNVICHHQAKQASFKDLSQKRCYIPCQSAFFRKDIIANVGLVETSYRWSSDWEYWLRICHKHHFYYIDEVLGAWRINPNNNTYNKYSQGYYKRYLETMSVSLRYGRNPLCPLVVNNVVGIMWHFFPYKSPVKKAVNFVKSCL